jgi:polyisoprenoid-binding protein YceI
MNVPMIGQPAKRVAITALTMLACSRGEPRTAFANSVPTRRVAAASTSPSAESAPGRPVRFVLAATGQAARYRVRERLVGHDFPNDAVGETKSITGAMAFDSSGNVIPNASKFVLDAGTFVSDKDRRDGFVRERLLEAEQYPSIAFVPTNVRGVGLPLPTSGKRPFEMTGDLTVRSVTRPTTWKGTVQFKDGRVSGSGATAFTFNDVQIEQPRVPVLLSVADTIHLEIEFNLIPQR